MVESNGSRETAAPEQTLAYGLLRIAFGVAFVGHGFFRILSGDARFAATTADHLGRSPLPGAFVYDFGLIIPWIELVLGIALVLGIVTRLALALGAIFMMALTIGASSNQDWPAVEQQLVYSVVFFVLLFALRYNALSLDHAMARGRQLVTPSGAPKRA